MGRHPLLKTPFALIPVIGLAVGLALLVGGSGTSFAAKSSPISTKTASSEKEGKDDKEDNDFLYVGDSGPPGESGLVRRFAVGALNPHSPPSGEIFVGPGSGGPFSDNPPLFDPRGLIFRHPGESQSLIVANELRGFDNDIDPCKVGSVYEFKRSGALPATLFAALIPSTNPKTPYAPDGIVLRDNMLYVASLFTGTRTQPCNVFDNGSIAQWKVEGNKAIFQRYLDASAFTGRKDHPEFHPRGLVFGPDGKLYASLLNNDSTHRARGGRVLRFDAEKGKFLDVFVDGGPDNDDPTLNPEPCGCDLNRPDGLVFGPNGKLYLTSFRDPGCAGCPTSVAPTNDKILIFDGPKGAHPGKYVDKIDEDLAGQDRAFGQALLFGPQGRLFIPITGNSEAFQGQVRRYNVQTKTFDVVVKANAAGGPLAQPVYLTFGKTDPATLAYHD